MSRAKTACNSRLQNTSISSVNQLVFRFREFQRQRFHHSLADTAKILFPGGVPGIPTFEGK